MPNITNQPQNSERLSRWKHQDQYPVLNANGNIRVLMVYDLASQPFSLGDILMAQEAALIQAERVNASFTDVAVVYDPARPVVPDPAFAHIRPENFLAHISQILPAAQVNPKLGSVFLFNSHQQLEKYIEDNSSSYHVWPPYEWYASKRYLFYYILNDVCWSHFKLHGRLPRLGSRPVVSKWAADFVRTQSQGLAPISIQLRNNPATPLRNTDNPSWRQFFEYCSTRYPVKFFVICQPDEVDLSLLPMSNVAVAKIYFTTPEQDLALVEACAMHMGASSGPGHGAIQ